MAVHVASGGGGGVEVDGVGAGTTVTMATVLRGGGGSVVVVKVIVVESAGEGEEGAGEGEGAALFPSASSVPFPIAIICGLFPCYGCRRTSLELFLVVVFGFLIIFLVATLILSSRAD